MRISDKGNKKVSDIWKCDKWQFLSLSSLPLVLHAGLGIRSLVFCANHFFWTSERVNRFFHCFVKRDKSKSLFYKEEVEQWRSICSFVSNTKRGKAWWKRITVKKSESLFYKEQIAPITVYLKMTFSPVALYKKRDGSKSLLSLFN